MGGGTSTNPRTSPHHPQAGYVAKINTINVASLSSFISVVLGIVDVIAVIDDVVVDADSVVTVVVVDIVDNPKIDSLMVCSQKITASGISCLEKPCDCND